MNRFRICDLTEYISKVINWALKSTKASSGSSWWSQAKGHVKKEIRIYCNISGCRQRVERLKGTSIKFEVYIILVTFYRDKHKAKRFGIERADSHDRKSFDTNQTWFKYQDLVVFKMHSFFIELYSILFWIMFYGFSTIWWHGTAWKT